MPQRTLTAFLECAGNGRTRFAPVPEGTPWGNDAAGNAIWEGVPLGIWCSIMPGFTTEPSTWSCQGGDFPEMQRGLPLAVARDPDTLLVLRMNGEPLTGRARRSGPPSRSGLGGHRLDQMARRRSTFSIVPSRDSGTVTTTSSGGRTAHRNARSREMAVKSVISTPLTARSLSREARWDRRLCVVGPWRRRPGRGQRRWRVSWRGRLDDVPGAAPGFASGTAGRPLQAGTGSWPGHPMSGACGSRPLRIGTARDTARTAFTGWP